jgi:hypothetical protein
MNSIRVPRELDEDEVIEQLDQIYGEVDICGIKFSSGQALKEIDPIAFRQSQLDLADSMGDLWECGVCGSQYDDEDDAEECCKDLQELKDGEED